jgi:hypothetical protein
MADSRQVAETRQEARRIIHELARAIDRRLAVEVRDLPGQERLQVSLTSAGRHGQIEVAIPAVLATNDDAVARNELRLKIKRAADTLQFRRMPDHRLSVKPLPPPGGQGGPRGPGGGPGGRGRR